MFCSVQLVYHSGAYSNYSRSTITGHLIIEQIHYKLCCENAHAERKQRI